MKNAVRDILAQFNCTYDEVIVPTATSMPIAIGSMIENMSYEGILCLGAVINNYQTPTYSIVFEELIRSLNEFSSYFNFPIGCAIYYSESELLIEDNTLALARDEAANVCNTIKMVAQLNNFGNQVYARERNEA